VAVNVALVMPAPMVTDCGIVRLGLVEVRDMELLVCAGLPRLRVQVLVPGVCIVAGVQIKLAALEEGVIVRAVERMTEPSVTEIVARPEALAPAEAVNTADEAPPATKTEAGTVTCPLLLLTVAVTPLAATGPLMEIVQLLALPAATVAGLQTTEESADCGATTSVNIAETPLYVAVSSTEPPEFEEVDPAWKFTLVDPAGTTTGEFTATKKLLLASDTLAPPAGAGPVSDTVHVLLAPGAIVPGAQAKPARAAGAG
jgi:hypothetical protein